jgi:nucleoside-diphosphate-sugar epimerase
MKVLLVGGAGHVGTFITPYLQKQHQIRVLDMAPPKANNVEYVEGSISDPEALKKALDGTETFINLVMKGGQDGLVRDQTIEQAVDNYTVNCLGLHLLLLTAAEFGIKGGVHTGTLSSHNRHRRYYPSEEAVPLDGPNAYGVTKGIAEHICHYFAREFDLSLAILRITGPRSRQQFIEQYTNPTRREWGSPLWLTDEEDLANAYLASLDYVHKGHGRCDAFFISGDADHHEINMSKAKAILGWEPRSHIKLGLKPPATAEEYTAEGYTAGS